MFAAVGASVARLVRTRIGSLALGDLPPGAVRPLTGAEAASVARDSARKLVVSLDGPASSGKSTVGGTAAERLGYRFCDTGLLYRALTWLALERSVSAEDEAALVALVPEISLAPDARGRLIHVRVGPADVTERVHTARVDRHVSAVARHAGVRTALLPVQRDLADGGGIMLAGRDIGTVVLPDADLKLWLHVSAEERARRRAQERGLDPNGEEAARMATEMRLRDEVDSSRAVAPLRVPDGAVVVESDGNSVEQTVDAVVRVIREAEARTAPP
jgi:cytidylate kinase